MRTDDQARAWPACAVLLGVLLAGCASSPRPPPEPALRKQAMEAEADGVRHYSQGDYSGAISRFAQARRLQQSLDDVTAAARNQLNQAHAELALGQPRAALNHAGEAGEGTLQAQALLIQAQAHLALGQPGVARESLARLEKICSGNCPQRGSMLVLRARVALAEGNGAQTLADAQAALPILKEQQEERETANAWRLIGAARLALSEFPAALTAAQTALEIDRQLALPEKIARDWILLGDIQRRAGHVNDARAAYQRAQSVARAAGLDDLIKLATEAITEKAQ